MRCGSAMPARRLAFRPLVAVRPGGRGGRLAWTLLEDPVSWWPFVRGMALAAGPVARPRRAPACRGGARSAAAGGAVDRIRDLAAPRTRPGLDGAPRRARGTCAVRSRRRTRRSTASSSRWPSVWRSRCRSPPRPGGRRSRGGGRGRDRLPGGAPRGRARAALGVLALAAVLWCSVMLERRRSPPRAARPRRVRASSSPLRAGWRLAGLEPGRPSRRLARLGSLLRQRPRRRRPLRVGRELRRDRLSGALDRRPPDPRPEARAVLARVDAGDVRRRPLDRESVPGCDRRAATIAAAPTRSRRGATLKPKDWLKQVVTVEGLEDPRLVAAGQPAKIDGPSLGRLSYLGGGVMRAGRPIRRGTEYTVWSYDPRPTPRALASAPARYPEATARYLELGRARLPGFGSDGRAAKLDALFTDERYQPLWPYRALWNDATRVTRERGRRTRRRCCSSAGSAATAASATRSTHPAGQPAARRLRRGESRGLLPALRGCDGGDAAPARDPRARRRRIHLGHVEGRRLDGHRPPGPRVGRGVVRGLRLDDVRPDAGAWDALGRLHVRLGLGRRDPRARLGPLSTSTRKSRRRRAGADGAAGRDGGAHVGSLVADRDPRRAVRRGRARRRR